MADPEALGGASGATAGAIIGSIFPGVGTVAGSVVGAAIGGGIGGLFRRRPGTPDLSGEIARIQALYERARAQAIAGIERRAGQARGDLASNLAARGILRSPVSERSFERLQEAKGQDIAAVEAGIGGQEAGAISGLLGQLLGFGERERERQERQRAELFGGLGSLGTALLLAGRGRQAPTAPRAQPFVGPIPSVPQSMWLDILRGG